MDNPIDESFELYFTWAVRQTDGERKVVELCKDGYSIPINESNKKEYVQKVIDFITYESMKDKIDALIDGFRSLIPLDIIQIFNPKELDFIISGQNTIDLEDWKQNTFYKGDFHEMHKVFTLKFKDNFV